MKKLRAIGLNLLFLFLLSTTVSATFETLAGSIRHGQITAVQEFLQKGGNPNLSNPSNGKTLLHEAVESEHPNIIRLLLENRANPNIQDEQGRTPFYCALDWLRLDGSKDEYTYDSQRQELVPQKGMKRSEAEELLALFLKHDANPAITTKYEESEGGMHNIYGESGLHKMARLVDEDDMFEWLLQQVQLTSLGELEKQVIKRDRQRGVEQQERERRRKQREERRKRLVVKVVHQDEIREWLQKIVIQIPSIEDMILGYLTLNIDVRDAKGRTAVHIAAMNRNRWVLIMLQEFGANVNSQDFAGNSPLHYLDSMSERRPHRYKSTRLYMVKTLVEELGANLLLVNNEGLAPLQIMYKDRGRKEMQPNRAFGHNPKKAIKDTHDIIAYLEDYRRKQSQPHEPPHPTPQSNIENGDKHSMKKFGLTGILLTAVGITGMYLWKKYQEHKRIAETIEWLFILECQKNNHELSDEDYESAKEILLMPYQGKTTSISYIQNEVSYRLEICKVWGNDDIAVQKDTP